MKELANELKGNFGCCGKNTEEYKIDNDGNEYITIVS